MKFENTSTYGWQTALTGMRNPMDSWSRSDSTFNDAIIIGPNDMKLAKQLINSGSEHRKFLRMIQIGVDITAPLYWWKEFETYKIGTCSDSCSTMHKIQAYPITTANFQIDNDPEYTCLPFVRDANGVEIEGTVGPYWNSLISTLEGLRQKYNEVRKENPEKAKKYWRALIQMLPEAWLQKRTVTMNYENAYNMYRQRKGHKLVEWSKDFIDWVVQLPYFKELFLD